MAFFEIEDLHVSYGSIKAVQGINFHVNEGEIVTLIGANGAGKSTIMKAISGLERVQSGHIRFRDAEITNLPSHQIVRKGISLSPEGRQVFPKMSVRENLEMGAYTDKSAFEEGIENAFRLFPRLKERMRQAAGTLSGGEQQMLAVARALMSKPKLLMLDEPSLGLAPIAVMEIFDLLKQIHEDGVTVLLVEQNARMALNVSDRGYVIETGRIVMNGTGEELLHNPRVIEYFLGGE